MKTLFRYVLFFIILMGLLISVLLFQLNEKISSPIGIKEPTLFTVKAGDSLNRFSKNLKNIGWIETRFWIRLYVRLNPNLANIKQGTYQVVANDTLESLLHKVVAGHEHQFSLTFVEGTTLKQWLTTLHQHPMIIQTQDTSSVEQVALTLGIAQANPEGWFFPETYAFTAGTSDIEVLKRAYKKMTKQLEELWPKRAAGLPYKNAYEALIMASIIEKETGQVSEQTTIASVFVNRLNKRMRLQTDPTVIYGLGDKYQGDITRKHLKQKTAYNTYRINGFPPTPIAMPGRSAIKAALHPISSNLYYFVSKGNGEHQFSATLSAHNAAVAKYQLGKK